MEKHLNYLFYNTKYGLSGATDLFQKSREKGINILTKKLTTGIKSNQ